MNEPGQFGDLFFLFLVVLPPVVTPEQIQQLQAIWPQEPPVYDKEKGITKVDMIPLTEEEDFGGESEDQEQPGEGEGGCRMQ